MSRMPRGMLLRDLIALVLTGAPDVENRIEKAYEWRRERALEIARWVMGISATITAGIVVAVVTTNPRPSFLLILITLILAALTGAYGVHRLNELRSLEREYVNALALAARLRKIARALVHRAPVPKA